MDFSLFKNRSGPFEFPPELWSFEEAGEEDGAPVSASSSEDEDDGDINADWESVGSESFVFIDYNLQLNQSFDSSFRWDISSHRLKLLTKTINGPVRRLPQGKTWTMQSPAAFLVL